MAYLLGEPTVQQYFDVNGDPLVNGTVEFYVTGTSTPATIYSDSAGTAIGTSVTLNTLGAPENSGTAVALFFDDQVTYKIIRKDASGTPIAPTIDPYKVNVAGENAPYAMDVIATLQANTNSILTRVALAGHTTEGDGGGGDFWFDTSDTSTADDNGINIVDAQSPRAGTWKRIYSGAINIRWYGAQDGLDSTASMQNALNFGARTVIIPDGAFGLASPGLDVPSNTTVLQVGDLIISTNIPAATYSAAIRIDAKTRSRWIAHGGVIDVSAATGYDNNVILKQDSTKCLLRDVDIIDGGLDRYPLGPIRSLRNTRCRFQNIDVDDSKGIALQTFEDSYCTFVNITTESPAGNKTAIETNNGHHNIYIGCEASTPLNTATSAFGFNDKKSICLGNRTVGGLHGLTVGHAAPYEADNSVVVGNMADSPADAQLNIQASKHTVLVGNVGSGGAQGAIFTTGSEKCALVGNVLEEVTTTGVRLGAYSTAAANVVDGFNVSGYRAHVDGATVVLTGNIGMNGAAAAFDWGLSAGQTNALLIGNLAGDDRGTPLLSYGFRSLSAQNLLLGNATDGNPVLNQFLGTYSSSPLKDLSDTTQDVGAYSNTTVGGAGSAGSGNQYVSVTIDGVSYKILHDGTI